MILKVLICWYIFCAVVITMVLMTMRSLTHSKFRDDSGDRTTEIGYEEDSQGHDLGDPELTNLSREDPHVSTPSSNR
jgi:hypothetical protein